MCIRDSVRSVGRDRREIVLPEAAFGAASDIAGALGAAQEMLPENTHQRVILLTDGLQTDGSLASAARSLAHRKIRLDALPYAPMDGEEVELSALEMPAEVSLGETCRVVVRVSSRGEGRAKLTLLDGEEMLEEETVRLRDGVSEFAYRITPRQAGMRAYTAVIEAEEDTLSENNSLCACVHVASSSRVLLVDGTGEESAALCALLEENGYAVDVAVPKDIPRTISAMCQYGVIVLMNVDERTLLDSSAGLLQEYVETYGRSVLTTGGENTYMYGHMMETPFDEFLPVRMEVREEESAEPMALFLVIDNSASMGKVLTAMAADTTNPLDMAKRGAIKSVSSLNDNDYVGVISFSDAYYILSDLTSMKNKDNVIARISRMGTVGGTMYCGALQEAYRQLAAFDTAGKKHVIFISDGNPGDEGYEDIISSMAADGITVSTIAVGLEINAELMRRLAELGGGDFTQVLDIGDLPAVMVSDTVLRQVDYTVEEACVPKVRQDVAGIGEDAALPAVGGYIRATLRPEASLVLSAREDRPIYAEWRYGKGLAGSFMSDMGGKWTAGWLSSQTGRQVLLELIGGLVPAASESLPVSAAIVPGGARCTLRVTCADAQEGQPCEADVRTPNGAQNAVRLTPMGEGIYEYDMPVDGYGRYEMTLRRYDAQGALTQTMETAAALSWSAEYEAFGAQEARAELESACAVTGGGLWRDARELSAIRMDDVYVEYRPLLALTLLETALVLIELLSRRLMPWTRLLRAKRPQGKL